MKAADVSAGERHRHLPCDCFLATGSTITDLTRYRAPLARVLRRSRDVGTAANLAGGHVIMKICFMLFAEGRQASSVFNSCSYIEIPYQTDRSPAYKEIVK